LQWFLPAWQSASSPLLYLQFLHQLRSFSWEISFNCREDCCLFFAVTLFESVRCPSFVYAGSRFVRCQWRRHVTSRVCIEQHRLWLLHCTFPFPKSRCWLHESSQSFAEKEVCVYPADTYCWSQNWCNGIGAPSSTKNRAALTQICSH
jgi:hypothetical protein